MTTDDELGARLGRSIDTRVRRLRPRDDLDMIPPGEPLVTNALAGLPQPVAKAQAQRLERKRIVIQRLAPRREPLPGGPTTEVIRGTTVSVEQYDSEGHRIKSSPVPGR